jgi:hypothetical protein
MAFPSVAARLACTTAVLALARSAFADDPPTFADRADDAIEDADESVAVLVSPLAVACGVFGGEADVIVQRSIALALDAAVYGTGASSPAPLGAVGAGVLLYPLGTALHAFYVEPRVVYTRALRSDLGGAPGWVSAVGVVGWQWTWDYGLSVRLGGGLAASTRGFPERAPALTVGPVALVADAALGWAW